MPPAARVTDFHQCNMSSGPVAHAGGLVLPPGSSSVITGFLPQARATDMALCAGGPPDFIVTGSASVLVDGKPAARKTDRTMHQPAGEIMTGFAAVDIGGPTKGAELGGGKVAKSACEDAQKGRTRFASATRSQSYKNNCGVESARQLINTVTGEGIGEDALLLDAILAGDAESVFDLNYSGATETVRIGGSAGGTSTLDVENILARHGVPSHLAHPTLGNIAQAVAEKRGVVSSHEMAILWGHDDGLHAVLTTGVQYDADGEPLYVIMNDSGNGKCGRKIHVDLYMDSLVEGDLLNVTNAPVWLERR